jgi:hypothetical protein
MPPLTQQRTIFRAYTIILLGLTLAVILIFPRRVNFDSPIYFELANRLLLGEVPYRDFFDHNLPTIHYISLIPVTIAQWTDIHVTLVYNLLVWLIVIYGIVASQHFLARHLGAASFYVMLLPTVLATHNLYLLLGNVPTDVMWGQRDHLFTILYIPAFFMRWARWNGVRVNSYMAVVVAILVGIGITIKPFFLILVAVPEFYWLLKQRKLKPVSQPETFALIGTLVLCVGLFFLLPSQSINYFFNVYLPDMSEHYLRALAYLSPTEILLRPINLIRLPFIVFLLFFPMSRLPDDKTFNLIRPMLLFGLINLFIVANQGRNLPYQTVPLLLMFHLSGAIFVSSLLYDANSGRWKRSVAPVMLGGQVALLYFFVSIFLYWSPQQMWHFWTSQNDRHQEIEVVVSRYADDGDWILYLSPYISSYTVMANTGTHQAAPYSHVYRLMHAYQDVEIPPGEFPLPDGVEEYITNLTRQIEDKQPKMILLHTERNLTTAVDPAFSVRRFFDETGYLDPYMDGWIQVESVQNLDVFVPPELVGRSSN